jgi:multidrug resistance efflux pump
MKTFYGICIAAIMVLGVITMILRRESSSFYGIADAQEIIINDEFAVEIQKIHIVQGQRVTAGDTLIEVKRPELDLKIAEISRQLSELQTQKSAHVNLSRSEVLQHKSEQEALVNNLRSQISELEAQMETNQKLVSELRSIKKGNTGGEENTGMANPVAIKIQQLKKSLEMALDTSNISMGRLNNELSYEGEPLAERVKGLKNELNMLLEEKKESCKIAPISGLIGSVNFKAGEKVSPFTPICSLHTESPSYIRGYIHENVYSQVAVGQKVRVSSLANKHTEVAGEVIGVGSRIVEYPVRLRKNPEMMMWGRDVTIKIPDANNFLLGEKVMISIIDIPGKAVGEQGGLSIMGSAAYAAGTTAVEKNVQMHEAVTFRDIVPAEQVKYAGRIEASGVLYLDDIDKYLVISDDTPLKKPFLFIMNGEGQIEKEAVIAGLQKINDMEGLAGGNDGYMYVLSSQSYNSSGKLSDARKLFLRVARSGESFTLKGSIQLYDVLHSAAEKNPEQPWARYLTMAIKDSSLDIEGVAFRQGELYLGIKNPLLDNGAVILNIGKADELFGASGINAADIAIWRQWKLIDPATGAPGHISDLQFNGDKLYALSVDEGTNGDSGKKSGALWRCRFGDEQPACIQHFTNCKPEGVAFNNRTGELIVTFDNGSKRPSQMITVRVEQ